MRFRLARCLQIPVNLVTATATLPSTSTPVTPTVAGGTAHGHDEPQPRSGATPAAACDFQENAAFVTQLQTLINDERTSNNLSALSVNADLAAAAKAHATDMLCNNYLSHNGLDGSTPEIASWKPKGLRHRLSSKISMPAPASVGNPQSAIDWWMSNPDSRADILNANTTVFGIAYVSSDESMLGGYFVVVSAKP